MLKIPEKLDVLLVQRADASFYPPTINQANILARNGIRVGLLDGGNESEQLPSLSSSVILLRPLYHKAGAGNALFVSFFKKLLKESNPIVCMSFDVAAAVLLGISFYKGKKINHFHEYPGDYVGNETLNHRLQNKIATTFSRKVDLVVMADSHRAAAYYQENRLSVFPLVVRNCSVKLTSLPSGCLKKKLVHMGAMQKWIVVFQGGISLNLYADKIVESMQFWPEGTAMVFIGPIQEQMRAQLEENAKRLGVMNDLFILGVVPYSELYSYTVDADIALTMIKPVTFNYMNMAGASNKRYDAMACGIPQISNRGPGMKELIEDNRIGVCIDPESSENIGKAVTQLLVDPERRQQMSETAREIHLSRFNYELEFAPVLNKIQKWCRETNEA